MVVLHFSYSSWAKTSNYFFCTSILLPSFFIIFTTITLNTFSGRLPISTYLVLLLVFYLIPFFRTCSSATSFCLRDQIWTADLIILLVHTLCFHQFIQDLLLVLFYFSSLFPILNQFFSSYENSLEYSLCFFLQSPSIMFH